MYQRIDLVVLITVLLDRTKIETGHMNAKRNTVAARKSKI